MHFEEAVRSRQARLYGEACRYRSSWHQTRIGCCRHRAPEKIECGSGICNGTIKTHISELYKKYKDGMIGEIVSAQAWWNNEGVWVNPSQVQPNRNGIPDAQLVLL
jgi:myo-inositol 2-dehydrogenase/D-chiro-inositol 1-dehydrogenase